MTTGPLLPAVVFRAVDATGAPLAGGKLQFYLTGSTTPTPVYTTSSLTTPLSNPVVADSGGLFAGIYLDPTVTYRMQLQTSSGSVLADVDPINSTPPIAAGSITAAMLASGVAVSNLGYTPVNKAGDTATNLLITATSLSATSAGYLGAPLNEEDTSYTFALSDAGKLVRANNGSAMTYTIPPNASVAFPIGTVIVVRNVGAGTVTITRGSGVTQYLAGGSTSKDVALTQWGLATLVQEAANSWVISGTNIS